MFLGLPVNLGTWGLSSAQLIQGHLWDARASPSRPLFLISF